MEKLNCWDVMKCGRNLDGDGKGLCPAASVSNLDGVNSGTNAGRVCWAVAGTQGNKTCNLTFSEKISDCVLCDFYQKVLEEEENFDIYPSDKLAEV